MNALAALCLLTSTLAAPEPTPPQQEPPTEPKSYVIAAALDPAAASVGQAARYTITITPQAPWVMKAETPFTAVLTLPQGVSAEKTKLDAKDFVDPKAPAKTAATKLTASGAGTFTVSTDVTFFICSSDLCKRQRERVTVQLVAR